MRLLRLLPVLAVLLCPLLARAQTPEAPAPFNPEPSARLLPPPEPVNHRVGRLLLESLGGAAGGFLGLTAGDYGAGAVVDNLGCGFDDCLEKDVVTLSALGLGLTPLPHGAARAGPLHPARHARGGPRSRRGHVGAGGKLLRRRRPSG
jgi:hypothetical protein